MATPSPAASGWASLPGECLELIFEAKPPQRAGQPWLSDSVLSLEERLRVEEVCKPWREQLRARPPRLSFLELGISSPGSTGGALWWGQQLQSSSVEQACAKARWAATRAPEVKSLTVEVSNKGQDPALVQAITQALQTLLGPGRVSRLPCAGKPLGACIQGRASMRLCFAHACPQHATPRLSPPPARQPPSLQPFE